jgi:hypothetical protein
MAKRFDPNLLPDPLGYYEAAGYDLTGRGPWRTTRCDFHGGSDSMRVNTDSGAFKCMNCGIHGGDVLAFHMQLHGQDFLEAAEALGAVVDDGRSTGLRRKTTLTASAALQLIDREAWLIVYALLSTEGLFTNPTDRARLIQASRVIKHVLEEVKS